MTDRLRIHHRGNIMEYHLSYKTSSNDLRLGKAVEIFEKDLILSQILSDDVRSYIWFIDCGYEGLDASMVQPLFYHMVYQYQLPPENFRVAFTCAQDISLLQYPAISIPDKMTYLGTWYDSLLASPINWQNFVTSYQVVCLMRRTSLGRVLVGSKLLKNFSRNDMLITLGAAQGADGDVQDEWKEMIAPHDWPLTVDGFVSREEAIQHRDDCIFLRAAVNLIVETSSQIDLASWNSIFITEKTYKAFGWHQFPVWYAVPGTVNEVRKQGFDVFDDIFENHYYDTIIDPYRRMDAVVNLVRRVCNRYDVISLRSDLIERLNKNNKNFEKIRDRASWNAHLTESNLLES